MWRYQAVYRELENPKRKEYSICEVYFDDDGKLKSSTESPTIRPWGESFADLTSDLKMMLEDAMKWEPVDFDKMEPGMTFIRTKHKK